ncbi:hypothetical protein L7F22_024263 [Adiantum nelumboides]|nr:hypothetical protein [Adiantum nelumboides]
MKMRSQQLAPSGLVATPAAATTHAGPSAAAIAIGFVICLAVALACLLIRKLMRSHEPPHHPHHLQVHTYTSSSAKTSPAGLDKSLLRKIKVSNFARKAGHLRTQECAVCLSPFEGHDSIRVLPHCQHAFHVACIDEWFEAHATCPICRDDIVVLCATMPSFSQSKSFSINTTTHAQDAHFKQGFDSNLVSRSLGMPLNSFSPCNKKAHDKATLLHSNTFHQSQHTQSLASSSCGMRVLGGTFNSHTLHPNFLKKSYSIEWDARSYPYTQSDCLSSTVENISTTMAIEQIVRASSNQKGQVELFLKPTSNPKRPPKAKSFGSFRSLRKGEQEYL